jgi:ferritin-like metal-binding protein YciE
MASERDHSVWDLLAACRAKALGIGLLSGGYARSDLECAQGTACSFAKLHALLDSSILDASFNLANATKILREAPMENNSLKELYIEQLRDIYDAENQLVKALPEMAKAATSEELRSGFENHLEQTKEHARRLERVFKDLGEKAKGKKCKGMQGLIAEGKEVIDEDFEDEVKDAALISAAQRVEHYEIAAYGTVRTYAEILGQKNAASLLEKTLEEEKETDEKLTELAEGINVQAARPETEQERSTNHKTKAARM